MSLIGGHVSSSPALVYTGIHITTFMFVVKCEAPTRANLFVRCSPPVVCSIKAIYLLCTKINILGMA